MVRVRVRVGFIARVGVQVKDKMRVGARTDMGSRIGVSERLMPGRGSRLEVTVRVKIPPTRWVLVSPIDDIAHTFFLIGSGSGPGLTPKVKSQVGVGADPVILVQCEVWSTPLSSFCHALSSSSSGYGSGSWS
jgi:hypothetical protein